MAGHLKLYHNPNSRAVTAHWMLEEVGADYELEHVEFRKDGQRDPKILAVNPMGKIPALVLDDGTVVTETPAILAWLADAYPDAHLAPALGTSERATYYRWLFFVGSAFEPALIERMMRQGAEPLPKMAPGWGSYDDVVDTVEETLGRSEYLAGGRFTAADLYMASGLQFAGLFKAPRVGESATIRDYLARISERSAFRRVFG